MKELLPDRRLFPVVVGLDHAHPGRWGHLAVTYLQLVIGQFWHKRRQHSLEGIRAMELPMVDSGNRQTCSR